MINFLNNFFLGVILFLGLCIQAYALDVKLTYPTQRLSGEALPLSEIANCKVVDVTVPAAEKILLTFTPNETVKSLPNSGFLEKRTLTAYCTDNLGQDSPRSANVDVKIDPAKAPGLSINIRVGVQ